MAETPLLTIKAEGETSFVLPLDDRKRIEAMEQYRHEIRRNLENAAAKPVERSWLWKEKLLFPAAIALLTIALSEWFIPRSVESTDQKRRQTEIAADLMREVGESSTQMLAAGDARSAAIDSFW